MAQTSLYSSSNSSGERLNLKGNTVKICDFQGPSENLRKQRIFF